MSRASEALARRRRPRDARRPRRRVARRKRILERAVHQAGDLLIAMLRAWTFPDIRFHDHVSRPLFEENRGKLRSRETRAFPAGFHPPGERRHFSLEGGFQNEMGTRPHSNGFFSNCQVLSGVTLALTVCEHGTLAVRSTEAELKRLSRVMCAVAIDDSDRHVFAHALALARRNDAKLLVVHAASPEVAFNRGATERVDFLRKLRSMAAGAGVDVRVTVQQGPAAEIILLHARARHADLLVLGTGRKEGRRGLSGWIAERVLRDAPCPTLVVPQGSDAPALVESILCAVDFSPASRAAVREAVRLSENGKLPVTLLHVVDGAGSVDYVHSGILATHEFHRGLGADALPRLQSLIPRLDHGAAVARVAVGRPAAEILRAARNMKAPLIVIGAARRTRIGSRLFGKTGQLLRDAHCPILAVPIPSAARQATHNVRKEAA
jgi:nucleotide-binding universal stress UspA family protein